MAFMRHIPAKNGKAFSVHGKDGLAGGGYLAIMVGISTKFTHKPEATRKVRCTGVL